MGRGNKSLMAKSGSHDQNGRHAHVTGDRFTINRTRVGNSQFYSRKKEV